MIGTGIGSIIGTGNGSDSPGGASFISDGSLSNVIVLPSLSAIIVPLSSVLYIITPVLFSLVITSGM